MSKKYPDSEAFHMAPNAGYDEFHNIKRTAEMHGSDIPDMGIGMKTKNAMIHEWDGMPYSQRQESNGSMNYMMVKEKIAGVDTKKLERSKKKDYE